MQPRGVCWGQCRASGFRALPVSAAGFPANQSILEHDTRKPGDAYRVASLSHKHLTEAAPTGMDEARFPEALGPPGRRRLCVLAFSSRLSQAPDPKTHSQGHKLGTQRTPPRMKGHFVPSSPHGPPRLLPVTSLLSSL